MANMGALFSAGQQVEHLRLGYRGLIFGIDPVFLLSDAWYQQMALSKPPKNSRWYHVLVHEADITTYVAERNLILYEGTDQIDHPLLGEYFEGFVDGRCSSIRFSSKPSATQLRSSQVWVRIPMGMRGSR